MTRHAHARGFTLIELSIVLVIIGLIAGGILVGQSLINAAAVRAQISQIEKYNTAVNTFRGKYEYLPGNIPTSAASQFGFSARAWGVGTGTGVILGGYSGFYNTGWNQGCGEVMLFWTDLSTANLIDGGFTQAANGAGCVGNNLVTATSSPNLSAFYPLAKIGNGNYIYVWSGGANGAVSGNNGLNYFGIEPISRIYNQYTIDSQAPGLTVAQAYAMDMKMDDGLPTSGRVTATGIGGASSSPDWLSGSANYLFGGPGPGSPAAAAATSCYDNAGNAANPMQYSLAQNTSTLNCALSFQFQ